MISGDLPSGLKERLTGDALADAALTNAAFNAPPSWQTQLQQRASRLRASMKAQRSGSAALLDWTAQAAHLAGDDADVAALEQMGVPQAEARAAAMLVDRLTIGCTLVEVAGVAAAAGEAAGESFERQLDILFVGIAAGLPAAVVTGNDSRQRSFQSKLWAFLRDARESANISFARMVHINELDRRILLLLQAQGGMTLAHISVACGVDKAQVSRAIKRMGEVSLLTRGGIRSPIRLSPAGKHLAERLMRQAELRNRELTFGISDDQIATMSQVLDTLLGRAITLFEQERKQAAGDTEPVAFQDLVDEGLPGENGVAVDRSRILPPFVTLCSYILRGGALAHKRQTGLSNFESWVMAEICRNPPISWPQLVVAVSRDQSQASRTVNHLIEIGLVERSGKPGRRHGFFQPTQEGLRISAIINETAERRSQFLFQGIPVADLETFMATFDALEHNAQVQLARERAIQDMDRS